MEVSKNRGTPKSSMLVECSIVNHLLGYSHLWKSMKSPYGKPDKPKKTKCGMNITSMLRQIGWQHLPHCGFLPTGHVCSFAWNLFNLGMQTHETWLTISRANKNQLKIKFCTMCRVLVSPARHSFATGHVSAKGLQLGCVAIPSSILCQHRRRWEILIAIPIRSGAH